MALIRSSWARWQFVRARVNWVLMFASGLALTRGVIYTLPTGERLPRGLDLLPGEALAGFGLMWLAAGLYGMWSAARPVSQRIARRSIGGLCMAWAAIYVAASFYDEDSYSLFMASILYFCVAGVAFSSKLRVRVEYKTIFIVHGQKSEAGFVMIEPEGVPDAE